MQFKQMFVTAVCVLFLMINYLHKFISNASEKTAPLRNCFGMTYTLDLGRPSATSFCSSETFIYDGAPAHNNPAIPGPNTELKKLPPYSPFLNIVEQAISSLKAAIKADISRPEIQEQMNNREEARRQGIALGNYRTQLLQQALQRNIGTITAAKCGQWYRFMQTYLPRCLNNEAIEG